MKLTQSFISDILTVTTLTYAATAATINTARAFAPIGNPKTISVIIPDKKINPYPREDGILKTQ